MLGENHSLIHEFPEYRDKIAQLKMVDGEFQRSAKEYHQLDHMIRGLEKRDVPTSDEIFEQLKVKRVKLKDKLYQMLKNGLC